jgi:hypothetical protein
MITRGRGGTDMEDRYYIKESSYCSNIEKTLDELIRDDEHTWTVSELIELRKIELLKEISDSLAQDDE